MIGQLSIEYDGVAVKSVSVYFPRRNENVSLELIELIGKGKFGSVYRASCREFPDIALKITTGKPTRLQQELIVMTKVCTKGRVSVASLRFAALNDTETILAIGMELCIPLTLHDFLVAYRLTSEADILNLCHQVVRSVASVHDEDCCHRDVKLQNLVFDTDMNVKLVDFGLAYNSVTPPPGDVVAGTISFMSPEMANNALSKQHRVSVGAPADVWSVGMVMLAIATQRNPYPPTTGQSKGEGDKELASPDFRQPSQAPQHNGAEGESEAAEGKDMLKRVAKGEWQWPHECSVSKELREMIDHILQVQPSSRPTLREVLRNPIWARKASSPCRALRSFLQLDAFNPVLAETPEHMEQLLRNVERKSQMVRPSSRAGSVASCCDAPPAPMANTSLNTSASSLDTSVAMIHLPAGKSRKLEKDFDEVIKDDARLRARRSKSKSLAAVAPPLSGVASMEAAAPVVNSVAHRDEAVKTLGQIAATSTGTDVVNNVEERGDKGKRARSTSLIAVEDARVSIPPKKDQQTSRPRSASTGTMFGGRNRSITQSRLLATEVHPTMTASATVVGKPDGAAPRGKRQAVVVIETPSSKVATAPDRKRSRSAEIVADGGERPESAVQLVQGNVIPEGLLTPPARHARGKTPPLFLPSSRQTSKQQITDSPVALISPRPTRKFNAPREKHDVDELSANSNAMPTSICHSSNAPVTDRKRSRSVEVSIGEGANEKPLDDRSASRKRGIVEKPLDESSTSLLSSRKGVGSVAQQQLSRSNPVRKSVTAARGKKEASDDENFVNVVDCIRDLEAAEKRQRLPLSKLLHSQHDELLKRVKLLVEQDQGFYGLSWLAEQQLPNVDHPHAFKHMKVPASRIYESGFFCDMCHAEHIPKGSKLVEHFHCSCGVDLCVGCHAAHAKRNTCSTCHVVERNGAAFRNHDCKVAMSPPKSKRRVEASPTVVAPKPKARDTTATAAKHGKAKSPSISAAVKVAAPKVNAATKVAAPKANAAAKVAAPKAKAAAKVAAPKANAAVKVAAPKAIATAKVAAPKAIAAAKVAAPKANAAAKVAAPKANAAAKIIASPEASVPMKGRAAPKVAGPKDDAPASIGLTGKEVSTEENVSEAEKSRTDKRLAGDKQSFAKIDPSSVLNTSPWKPQFSPRAAAAAALEPTLDERRVLLGNQWVRHYAQYPRSPEANTPPLAPVPGVAAFTYQIQPGRTGALFFGGASCHGAVLSIMDRSFLVVKSIDPTEEAQDEIVNLDCAKAKTGFAAEYKVLEQTATRDASLIKSRRAPGVISVYQAPTSTVRTRDERYVYVRWLRVDQLNGIAAFLLSTGGVQVMVGGDYELRWVDEERKFLVRNNGECTLINEASFVQMPLIWSLLHESVEDEM